MPARRAVRGRLDAVSANEWEFDPWGNYDRLASPAWDVWHLDFRTGSGRSRNTHGVGFAYSF